MLDDNLRELAEGLMRCYEEAYNLCYPEVERIIKYKIKDINIIEHTLDMALNIYTEKGLYFFLKQLLYYRTINLENAYEYFKILKEDRMEEYDEFVKKYKKIK